MTPLEKGILAHLVADWVLQNDWMARNKTCLRHPAGWVHGAIHGICLGVALGWLAGLVLGFVHVLVDTRVPLAWWMRVFKKCGGAPEAMWIWIWLDQTVHVITIALWVAWT
jgi:hypothetical protein